MKVKSQWFRVHAVAGDPTVVDIQVIDIIGDWIDDLINQFWGIKATLTAKDFIDQLSQLDAAVKTIRLHINSPGGDVFAALNIANALRDQQMTKGRTVETFVDGLAASAASIIAMAGSRVVMGDNALMMIHQPMTVAAGNAKDLRTQADVLDTITKTLVATYQWHSELEDAEIVAMLDAETWLSADEAIAAGLATEKSEGLAVAALLERRAVDALTVPEKYRARVAAFAKPAPAPATPASSDAVLAAVETAGLPVAFARECLTAAVTLEQLTARIEAKTTEVAAAEARARDVAKAAETRATDIRAVCQRGNVSDLADDFIAGGMTVEAVRAAVTKVTAKLDRAEIDTKLSPAGDAKPSTTTLVTDSYRALNQKATKE